MNLDSHERKKHFTILGDEVFFTIKNSLTRFLTVFAALFMFASAHAVIETYEFDNQEQREQFNRLNVELRCPQCQNQSIADSNSPVAQDLRREVHRLIVEEEADEKEVIDFMIQRYGDFVLYKPKMDARTLVLWFGPLVLLLLGFIVLVQVLRKYRAQGADEEETLAEEDKAQLDKILGGK